jgi:peptidoglycan/xylan/chitin deacetylase (PgdA/CDA1 family)
MITLGAASAALLLTGDRVKEIPAANRHPLAPGRAVIPPANISPKPTPTPKPPTPLPRRKEAIHKVHDVLPTAPPNAISLTIDDGPHPEWTPKMLDLLAEHDVKATFSLIGIQVKQFPHLVQRIAAAGHQICNHTMNHPLEIAEMSSRHVDREITEANDRIGDAAGIAPKYFRSPGGAWSRAVFASAARHGMLPIDWEIDPRDWARPGIRRIKRSLLEAKGGDILLCHDGGGDRSETIKALGQVVPKLQARGLSFVLL